jgi:hypothetical protein
MKKLLILTLLLLVAAFSFSQTNQTFNNLDVRGTSKLRGLIYPFGAVATTPIVPAVHEVLMVNNSTFAMCRMDFEEFADSIANHLNPIIGTHWYTVAPDTIKTIYNVLVDSSFAMKYSGWFFGYGDPNSNGYNGLGMYTPNGSGFWTDDNGTGTTGMGMGSASIGITYGAIVLGSTGGRSLSLSDDNNVVSIASDSVYIAGDKTVINGDLTVTGQIKYDFIHMVAYLTGATYTPNVSTNTPFKLVPGMTVTENDGLTIAGDSITIITPGDYKLDIVGVSTAESANWKLTVRKNGTLFTSGHCAWTSTGSTIYDNFSWFYYFPSLAAGDDISFYITNETGSNDPTFRALKYYIEMKPE